MTDTHFKGWAIPGPQRKIKTPTSLADDVTVDAGPGHYRLLQLRNGHRYSTDDVLAAWYGVTCCPSAQRVLDLGSGISSVATFAAWRLQGVPFVTIEAQEQSVVLARQSAQINGLDDRFDIRLGDFRTPGVLTPDEHFDLIMGSPPYFPLGSGELAEHPQKVACRFETRGAIDAYALTASQHLSTGGVFVCVFPITPAHQAARVVAAAKQAGLTIFRSREVCTKQGEPPLLGVFAMMRTQDLPPERSTFFWKEPPLTIRLLDNSTSDEYTAVKLSMGLPPTS